MKSDILIVDYGMGNLRSVQKALEKVGARAKITSSPEALKRAAAVVLPGVGAFGEAMRRLKALRLVRPLQSILASEKPFLGICLGLQLLFETSEEDPGVKGLGFLRGRVRRFRLPKALKVPHIGWNSLNIQKKTPFYSGIHTGDYFYFVHSYYPQPADSRMIASTTPYASSFCSAVANMSLFACQYHPEKSGEKGLKILRNFVKQAALC